LPLLDTAISDQQLKRNVSVWFPLLVVASNAWRLAQVSESECQSRGEWPARLGVMNDADDGWFRKETIDHHLSYDYVRCHAEHRELKVCKLRSQLKQIR